MVLLIFSKYLGLPMPIGGMYSVFSVPVPKEIPPIAAAYQLITPAEAVAVKVATPAPQMVVGGETLVMVGMVFIIISILFLIPLSHKPSDDAKA